MALGAESVEKHVNLDNKVNYGPDRHVSISFKKFAEMVKGIRKLEKSLGTKKRIYKKKNRLGGGLLEVL